MILKQFASFRRKRPETDYPNEQGWNAGLMGAGVGAIIIASIVFSLWFGLWHHQ